MGHNVFSMPRTKLEIRNQIGGAPLERRSRHSAHAAKAL